MLRHIVYLTKDDQAISAENLPEILEMFFNFTLGGQYLEDIRQSGYERLILHALTDVLQR